jgi:hypothetical protein
LIAPIVDKGCCVGQLSERQIASVSQWCDWRYREKCSHEFDSEKAIYCHRPSQDKHQP